MPELNTHFTDLVIERLEAHSIPFEVIDKESGGVNLQIKGSDNAVKYLTVEPLDLTQQRFLKIHKTNFPHEQAQNLWIALILTMDDMKPVIYLIPITVFETETQIFKNHDIEPHTFASNWEIRVFTNGIQELCQYALEHQIKHLI
ncbi:hypothetical protein KFE98_17760 [bacterium SCSIO 12741]|nr:hypothetical protein KFE98_17760 [bacterium SCSIO 12741]